MTPVRSKTIAFVLENSLLLLVGTAVAVLWANLGFDSYDAVAQPSNKSTWRPRFGLCRRFIVPLSTCSTLRN